MTDELRTLAIRNEIAAVKRMVQELEVHFESAFVGGDPHAHRKEHEAEQLRKEQRRQMWDKFFGNVTTGVLGGVLVVIAIVAWILLSGRVLR